MSTITLEELERQVWGQCQLMANDPQARFESRCSFYERYGGGAPGPYGYGTSELAFMQWEMKGRLVANGGSAWWSAVNLRFIYFAELGARSINAGIPADQLPHPSRRWVEYIQQPGPDRWYRAHNTSIAAGYEEYKPLALQEPWTEQSFINMVLYRLLYAQSMVEGWSIAGSLGSILANPDGDAVGLITSMVDLYPPHYPMSPEESREMFGRYHNLEEFGAEFFDDVVIASEFAQLYDRASIELRMAFLRSCIASGLPCYPTGRPVFEGRTTPLLRWLRRIWRILFGPWK